jgi:hypothetical protein
MLEKIKENLKKKANPKVNDQDYLSVKK